MTSDQRALWVMVGVVLLLLAFGPVALKWMAK